MLPGALAETAISATVTAALRAEPSQSEPASNFSAGADTIRLHPVSVSLYFRLGSTRDWICSQLRVVPRRLRAGLSARFRSPLPFLHSRLPLLPRLTWLPPHR
jgi:hypothetical protein